MTRRLWGLVPLILAWPCIAAETAGFQPLMPEGAEVMDLQMDPPGRYGVARDVWSPDGVAVLAREGGRTRQAWRLPDVPGATAAMMAALRAQLRAEGFEIVLSCAARDCGGFDFRRRLDVLPLPAMFVDLGSFSYLSARRGDLDADGVLVAVLASASGAWLHVQVDVVTPQMPVQPAPEPSPVPATAPAARAGDVAAPPSAAGSVAEDPAQAFERSGSFVLEDLAFAPGASDLQEGAQASLAALADFLAANPAARIALVGHTDTTGGSAGNRALSQRRAQSVADRLVARHGIAPRRIEVSGIGYLAPRASNATAEGRARNRRVTAVLLPPG